MENIGKLNAAIYRNLQSILNYKLRDIPIRSGQHDFLYVISQNEGITQKELSEMLYVDKSTTAKAVKSLISYGYIKKEPMKEDKRFERLYLTEQGNQIKAQIQETFLEVVKIITCNMSEQEANQAAYLLKNILETLMEEKKNINEKNNEFSQ